MRGTRPKSDILSRLTLGLAVLALAPSVLPRYGVDPHDLMAPMAGTAAIVLLLFVDVLRVLLRVAARALDAITERLRAYRRLCTRLTPGWRGAQALAPELDTRRAGGLRGTRRAPLPESRPIMPRVDSPATQSGPDNLGG